MKIFAIVMAAIFVCLLKASSQIQKGNIMAGSDISRVDLSFNEGTNFSFVMDPKAAWFIKNNIDSGKNINFNLVTAKGPGFVPGRRATLCSGLDFRYIFLKEGLCGLCRENNDFYDAHFIPRVGRHVWLRRMPVAGIPRYGH